MSSIEGFNSQVLAKWPRSSQPTSRDGSRPPAPLAVARLSELTHKTAAEVRSSPAICWQALLTTVAGMQCSGLALSGHRHQVGGCARQRRLVGYTQAVILILIASACTGSRWRGTQGGMWRLTQFEACCFEDHLPTSGLCMFCMLSPNRPLNWWFICQCRLFIACPGSNTPCTTEVPTGCYLTVPNLL